MDQVRKINVRLPAQLGRELADLAEWQRVSQNAVIIAALRNYLPFASRNMRASQSKPPAAAVSMVSAEKSGHTALRAAPAARESFVKPSSVNAPCPCGSGEKWKRCHGRDG